LAAIAVSVEGVWCWLCCESC